MAEIILFRGKVATGKTTMSNELGKALQVPVIHKDDIYDSIANFIPEHGLRNKICFDYLYRFLETVIKCNARIILDFGLNDMDDVRRLKTWVELRGSEFKSILCLCVDETIWSTRLEERNANPLPNQFITNLAALKKHYMTIKSGSFENELILDTAENRDRLLPTLLNFIQKS
jgi:predicted kinase